MKKLISYVWFGDGGERYYSCLPSILITNFLLYDGFILKFYVHKELLNHKAFSLLTAAQEQYGNIEIEIIDVPYKCTELTLWRMKPLWDADVDLFFCRDLDAVVRELEHKSVLYFLQHPEYCAHGIRSYSMHTVPFLAGLCGFKVKNCYELIKTKFPTFDSYIEKNRQLNPDGVWGCDQSILRDHITPLISRYVLDCPQQTAPNNISGYSPSFVCPQEVYTNIPISDFESNIINYIDKLSGFAGNAFVMRPDKFLPLLEMTKNTKITKTLIDIFKNDPDISKLYGINTDLI